MPYYPIFLDISGRDVVVIGAGIVALRKVEGLLEVNANVRLISPDLHPDLEKFVESGQVQYEQREYRPGDLTGAALAFVASDDRTVNAAVAQEGKERRVWVNAVDDPPNCDFIMPGIVRRGDLTVAVSTSGGSPALARVIREELEEYLTEDYVRMLDLVAEVRAELRSRGVQVDPEVWNAALKKGLREMLSQGRREEAKEKLLRSLLQPAGGT